MALEVALAQIAPVWLDRGATLEKIIATLDEAAVRDYCKGQIAHFKIPRFIRFVEEFPMTVTGKLQKFRMREAEVEMRQAEGPN